MIDELVFRFVRRKLQRAGVASADAAAIVSRGSTADYADWRESTQERMFFADFADEVFSGRDVLDFGCGVGTLSYLMSMHGARHVVGVDLSEASIEKARQRRRDEPVEFRLATNERAIDIADESVDVVACFDVMEHIMAYAPIIREWHRVLRPAGRVLVHWQPYFHPYGHHMQDYLPVPWVHLLLSGERRRELCARVVDLPDFDAPWWDRDEHGNRINRFRVAPDGPGFLNRLSMRRFERICTRSGFRVACRTLKPFSGSSAVVAVSRALTRVPLLREGFTAHAVYALEKI